MKIGNETKEEQINTHLKFIKEELLKMDAINEDGTFKIKRVPYVQSSILCPKSQRLIKAYCDRPYVNKRSLFKREF